MEFARSKGINVPHPKNVCEVEITPEYVAKLSLLERHNLLYGHVYTPQTLVGRKFPAMEEEFIEGKTLIQRWMPSRKINHQIRDLRRKIRSLDMAVTDDMHPWNYILTPKGEVFLVDCVGLKRNASQEFIPYFMNELVRRFTPTSKIDTILTLPLQLFIAS